MSMGFWQLAIIWVVVSTVVTVFLDKRSYLPDNFNVTGPLVLIHTKKGNPAISQIEESYRPVWSHLGRWGVRLFGGFLLLGVVLVVVSVQQIIQNPSSRVIGQNPQNVLAVPGLNKYIPLEVAPEFILAILIAMVVHELGHGIYCVYNDIGVDSTGVVLLAGLPIGAFVEPDEDGVETASPYERLQMFSAGVMNNAITVVIFTGILLLALPLVVTPASGVPIGGVLDSTPASASGLQGGTVIESVNGTAVSGVQDFESQLKGAEVVEVTTVSGETYVIERQTTVSSATTNSPFAVGQAIQEVNNTQVNTVYQFKSTVREYRSETGIVEITRNSSTTRTPIGASVITSVALEKSTSNTTQIIIVSANQTDIYNSSQLRNEIISHKQDTMIIEYLTVSNSTDTYTLNNETVNIEKFTNSSSLSPGISGASFVDIGVQYYPHEQYYNIVSGSNIASPVDVLTYHVRVLLLPFGELVGLQFNFDGFSGVAEEFYTTTILEENSEPILFFFSVAFWSVWINVTLILFNVIPAYALDGGHYMRDAINIFSQKLGIQIPERVSSLLLLLFTLGIGFLIFVPPLL